MPKERLSGGKRIESCRITAPASKSPLVSPAAIAICKADIRAFFSRFTQGASAKTVWGSMRAEQVSIAQRWRRPRGDPEYTERRSDAVQAAEKCSSVFERFGVPVLQALISSMTREQWQRSARGLNPLDTAM